MIADDDYYIIALVTYVNSTHLLFISAKNNNVEKNGVHNVQTSRLFAAGN